MNVAVWSSLKDQNAYADAKGSTSEITRERHARLHNSCMVTRLSF